MVARQERKMDPLELLNLSADQAEKLKERVEKEELSR